MPDQFWHKIIEFLSEDATVMHRLVGTVLGQYLGHCMVSLININNAMKKTYPIGIKIVYQSNLDISCVCQDKRIFLYPTSYLGIILVHIGTRVLLPRCEGSWMIYRPKWHRKHKYPQSYTDTYWYQKL